MKSTYKCISKAILLFMCIFFLAGCSSPKLDKVDESVTSDSERVMTISDEDVSVDEVMLYLLQVKKEFEKYGGEDVWDHDDFSGGKKAEEVAKLAVLDSIAKRKIYASKSSEIGINLTEEETQEAITQAINYYESLDQDELDQYHLTKDNVIRAYKEFNLATKVENEMLNEHEPKEEDIKDILNTNDVYTRLKGVDKTRFLRKIKVQQITLKTHEKDDDGNNQPLSKNMMEEVKKKSDQVYQEAVSGADFAKLVEQYSEGDTENNGEAILATSVLPDSFKVLGDLEIGDISPVLEDDEGYHIIKVLDYILPTKEDIQNYEDQYNQWVDLLKEEATKTLKQKVVNEVYEEWKSNTNIDLNEELWEKIDVFGNINKNTNK